MFSRLRTSSQIEGFWLVSLFARDDLYARRIPLWPLPPLYTHGPEREQGDRPVAFAKLDAASDLRMGGGEKNIEREEVSGERRGRDDCGRARDVQEGWTKEP